MSQVRRPFVLVALAAALSCAGALVAVPPASAAGGTFTQTSGITVPEQYGAAQNATTLDIPAVGSASDTGPASPYPLVVNTSGLTGVIADVDVNLLQWTHTHPDDVDVLLVGPNGQQVVLASDAGGSTDISNQTVTIDDEAAAPLPDSAAITTGSFRPSNYDTGDAWPAPAPSAGAGSSLSVLDGGNPNGTWSLYVVDDGLADTGKFAGGFQVVVQVTPPASPYPSTLAVSGLPKGVTDVNVVLTGVTHTAALDLDVMLVGPGGQRAMVMSDAGAAAAGVSLVLDDEAATPLPNAPDPLSSGTFKPTNYTSPQSDAFQAPAPDSSTASGTLSVFDGTDPNGTWRLFAADDQLGDTGSLSGWALQITTADLPASPAITAPASGTRDRDGALFVAGTAPAGTSVTVLEGAINRAIATASATGQWVASVGGLANGSHTLTATATDSRGNTSAVSTGVVVVVDSIKPLVSSTRPSKGAKGVNRTRSITARTNEAVRPATVTKASAFLVVAGTTERVRAKVSWRPATRTIVINPRADLRAHQTYKVTITTAVLDLAGNPLDQNRTRSGLQKKTWRFTTG